MTQQPSWRLIGQSVRGASHNRSGLPNQDALLCQPLSEDGPPLIMAVSDGHGSSKSFRSDRGSQFAVDTVAALMQELVDGRPATPNLSAVKRVSEERLPRELVRRWSEAVDADLRADPFTDEELARLAAQRGDHGQKEVIDNPRLAYGATALGVLVERDFLLFLQLGDGDILTVADSGEVIRPFSRDSRLIANETTSLCMDQAWREVRLRFQAQFGPLPALILIATDGYANSFVNDAAFLRVGSDILVILRREGVAVVEDSLVDWLQEASEAGSGDDITLGIALRMDAVASGSGQEGAVKVAADTGRPEDRQVGESELDVGRSPAGGAAGTVSGAPPQGAVVSEAGHDPGSDPALRHKMLAQLKHEGPSEPSKQGGLRDLVDGDDVAER